MDIAKEKHSNFEKFFLCLRKLLSGKIYPLMLALAILISHSFSIEELGITVVLATVLLGLLVCDDLKFFIAPLTYSLFMFSEKSVATGKYYEKPYLIAIACGSVVLISFFVAHFIIYRKNLKFKDFTKSRLLLGFIFLSASALLNGCLNFKEYQLGNILYALAFVFSLLGIFFLFSVNLNKDASLTSHLMYVLFLMSALVTLELFIAFTNQIQFANGEIVKESVKVGWGMWNNIGGVLTLLLPIHFYYATTVKRYGAIFYITGLISYGAIVLTLSRSSLLVSSFILLACVVISCFFGKNKLINRIFTGALFTLGIIAFIVLWGKISSILGDYLSRGLDDNGRFEMYLHGLKNFLSHPIFGGGFNSSYATEHQFIIFLPYRYHNTIIQMMATCGSVGLLSYLFHRYQTVKLFIKERCLSNVFLALSIIGLLLTSLLDNHFFNIYPAFIYTIIIVVIEKNSKNKGVTH